MSKFFPKILHLYWDGSPFSFLNMLTVLSFRKHHIDWKIKLYQPLYPTINKTWINEYNKNIYKGKCFFDELKKRDDIDFEWVNFESIGFSNDISEIIKSDYFRYYILAKEGGMWSDFDILYINNIDSLLSNINEDVVLFKTNEYYTIGILIAKEDNQFFKYIVNLVPKYLDNEKYESIGSSMFNHNFKNVSNLIDNKNYCDKIKCLDSIYYLPFQWFNIDLLYKFDKNFVLPEITFGIHWFNGAIISKDYCLQLDQRLYDLSHFNMKSNIDYFICPYVDNFLFNEELKFKMIINNFFCDLPIYIIYSNEQYKSNILFRFKQYNNIKFIPITSSEKYQINYISNFFIKPSTLDLLLTHIITLKQIYEDGYEHAVILDDSIQLDFLYLAKYNLNDLILLNVDCIQLTSIKIEIDNNILKLFKRKISDIGCNYLISKEGIKRFFENSVSFINKTQLNIKIRISNVEHVLYSGINTFKIFPYLYSLIELDDNNDENKLLLYKKHLNAKEYLLSIIKQ